MTTIRPATEADVALIHEFVCELAEYEKLRHEVEASEADMREALFGQRPRAFCDIAEFEGAPAGFALWFYNFSTFRGRAGLYLEDLFVRPHLRGHGIGRALLRHLAQRCIAEKLGRFEWSVLDWNAPSRRFYEGLGARPMTDWIIHRVTGDALARLAAEADGPRR
jgi:GNAT superfamily N-acetyltransferase